MKYVEIFSALPALIRNVYTVLSSEICLLRKHTLQYLTKLLGIQHTNIPSSIYDKMKWIMKHARLCEISLRPLVRITLRVCVIFGSIHHSNNVSHYPCSSTSSSGASSQLVSLISKDVIPASSSSPIIVVIYFHVNRAL